MENLYRQTFDKINMPDESSMAIRKSIELTTEPRPRSKQIAMKIIIAAASVIAALMLIPQSRGFIISAAQSIARVFSFANGDQVTMVTQEEETMAVVDGDQNFTYISVNDERVFFVLGDIHEDITEKIGGERYYRYEISNADGGRSVILIGEGGLPGTYGWIELVFDANGNYVTNRMNIPVDTSSASPDDDIPWHDIAMHNEGVPCGNPELDALLP